MKSVILNGFLVVLVTVSGLARATQDVESPYDVLAYLRMLLIEPEISQEIVEIGQSGCTWADQVIWGGSPSEKDLATGIFWQTLSMQFVNSSDQEMWVQFAFSSKDGELLELKNVTDASRMIDCSK